MKKNNVLNTNLPDLNCEKTWEVCPHCDTEVELEAELKVQKCPNCGRYIVTCSMCINGDDGDEHICTQHCCLEVLANKMNDEVFESIMDTTNGHREDLVTKINKLWNDHREEFAPILCALYKRDFEEIYNADSFADLPDDKEQALAGLINEWDFHAYNYLQHISDDLDLQTIINFIRR